MTINDIELDLVRPSSNTARRLAIHIRKNNISNHPAIIIGEDGKSYLFLPMTTNNIAHTKKLKQNPNPKSNETSYVIFRMRANNYPPA